MSKNNNKKNAPNKLPTPPAPPVSEAGTGVAVAEREWTAADEERYLYESNKPEEIADDIFINSGVSPLHYNDLQSKALRLIPGERTRRPEAKMLRDESKVATIAQANKLTHEYLCVLEVKRRMRLKMNIDEETLTIARKIDKKLGA